MFAKYIIRLDDASEYMDYEKWNPYFKIFDNLNIKPIIAVIPFNKDPKMVKENFDSTFWEKVRFWQTKGYHIALHGFNHVYSTHKSGLIGINNRSEFAGVLLEKQKEMLSKAFNKFESENIKVNIFIAPAHSFDRNTLEALTKTTRIEYICDGFFKLPIIKYGFKWIPQQLWKPKLKTKGIWTICHHPETVSQKDREFLFSFLETYKYRFINPFLIEFKSKEFLFDYISRIYLKLNYKLKSQFLGPLLRHFL